MVKSAAMKVMWVGRATVFMVGLAVILALTVGVASTAFGADGGNFILGQTNSATAITKLAGAAGVAGPSLQIDNNSSGAAATALDLQVEPGKAPMKVNSGTQVANLNADKVDGKDANQLVRVASFAGQSPLADGTSGKVATTTINAPAPGFLVIDASSDVSNNGESAFPQCFIRVDGFPASGSRMIMQLNESQGSVNTQEDCATNAVVPVAAGTHTVDLEGVADGNNTLWEETTLSAIYIPFNGSGASPSSAAISAAQ
jgi:hypothetical protein